MKSKLHLMPAAVFVVAILAIGLVFTGCPTDPKPNDNKGFKPPASWVSFTKADMENVGFYISDMDNTDAELKGAVSVQNSKGGYDITVKTTPDTTGWNRANVVFSSSDILFSEGYYLSLTLPKNAAVKPVSIGVLASALGPNAFQSNNNALDVVENGDTSTRMDDTFTDDIIGPFYDNNGFLEGAITFHWGHDGHAFIYKSIIIEIFFEDDAPLGEDYSFTVNALKVPPAEYTEPVTPGIVSGVKVYLQNSTTYAGPWNNMYEDIPNTDLQITYNSGALPEPALYDQFVVDLFFPKEAVGERYEFTIAEAKVFDDAGLAVNTLTEADILGGWRAGNAGNGWARQHGIVTKDGSVYKVNMTIIADGAGGLTRLIIDRTDPAAVTGYSFKATLSEDLAEPLDGLVEWSGQQNPPSEPGSFTDFLAGASAWSYDAGEATVEIAENWDGSLIVGSVMLDNAACTYDINGGYYIAITLPNDTAEQVIGVRAVIDNLAIQTANNWVLDKSVDAGDGKFMTGAIALYYDGKTYGGEALTIPGDADPVMDVIGIQIIFAPGTPLDGNYAFTVDKISVGQTVAAAQTFTVTFNKNTPAYAPGTDAVPASKTVVENETVGTLPTPPVYAAGWDAGVTFDGWYTTAATGGTAFTAGTSVTTDLEVFARWKFTAGDPQVVGETLVIDAPLMMTNQGEGGAQSVWNGTVNPDGSVTYTGGAVRYKFPDDVSAYDFFTLEYITEGSNPAVILKQFNTGTDYFPGKLQDGNRYPTLAASGSLEFFIRGAGTTGGVAMQSNSFSGTVKFTKVTFTKGIRHTITFDIGYPEGESISSIVGVEGTTIGALPVPADREGFVFSGWIDEEDNPVAATVVVAGSLALKAKWTDSSGPMELQVTVTTNANSIFRFTMPDGKTWNDADKITFKVWVPDTAGNKGYSTSGIRTHVISLPVPTTAVTNTSYAWNTAAIVAAQGSTSIADANTLTTSYGPDNFGEYNQWNEITYTLGLKSAVTNGTAQPANTVVYLGVGPSANQNNGGRNPYTYFIKDVAVVLADTTVVPADDLDEIAFGTTKLFDASWMNSGSGTDQAATRKMMPSPEN